MKDLLSAASPLLKDLLSPAVMAQLSAASVQKRFSDGQLIQSRGDTKLGLSVIISGSVSIGNIGDDGSYIKTGSLGAGHCYGELSLFAGLPRTHDVTSKGETVVEEISKAKFLAVFREQPSLAEALLTISLVRTHTLLEFMDDLRRLPLDVRVAKFLYRAFSRAVELEVKQEELAFSFGVSRVSMGKVLKNLEQQGLLKLGYKKISVSSIEHLASWLSTRTLVVPIDPTGNQSLFARE